jgi:hypothetical protein
MSHIIGSRAVGTAGHRDQLYEFVGAQWLRDNLQRPFELTRPG